MTPHVFCFHIYKTIRSFHGMTWTYDGENDLSLGKGHSEYFHNSYKQASWEFKGLPCPIRLYYYLRLLGVNFETIANLRMPSILPSVVSSFKIVIRRNERYTGLNYKRPLCASDAAAYGEMFVLSPATSIWKFVNVWKWRDLPPNEQSLSCSSSGANKGASLPMKKVEIYMGNHNNV